MPIPYMGSKRKSADKIFALISQRHPEADTLVDLFCGGFAVSEKFMKNGWNIIANDINKYVIALIDQTIHKGLDEDIVTQFVTRAKFGDVIKNPGNYDDWYVGFVACIWSFGNNNKGYLFGKDVEFIKHAAHKLVIDKDSTDITTILPQIPKKYIDGILEQPDWHKRRMALVKVAKAMQKRPLELQRLEQLERLQRLQQLEQPDWHKRRMALVKVAKAMQKRPLELQQLEQLERLQQLQRLQRLQRLQHTDYKNVKIPEGAIVYCDPPYRGTAKYTSGDFNHDEFWQWAREASEKNPVYISEYSAPSDFKVIRSFPQKSTLQGGQQKHNNQPDEKIFVYDKIKDYDTKAI